MLQIARWRLALVLAVVLLGVLFAAPNVMPQSIRDSLPGFLPKQTINLGLDLRGGSHLLLEVDTADLRTRILENVSDNMGSALRDAEPRIRFSGRGVVGGAARVRLVDAADAERSMEIMRKLAVESDLSAPGVTALTFTAGEDGLIEGRISDEAMALQSRQAAQQSIEIIRRRIDPTGTSEVSITRQGDQRIVVQAPGLSDPEQLKERIGQTALLTFHLVDETANASEAAAGRVPAGSMVAAPYPQIGDRAEIVRRRPSLTGENLANATPSFDSQTQQTVLSFSLDSKGSRIFCRLSTENVGQRFAILLDGQVLTAPVIRNPICGGRGQIEGNFTIESAQALAVMLRAGALPAPLTVIEERTVDPSLGQDAIDSGTQAAILACLVTLIFMVLAYGLFGGIAVVALLTNGVLIIAAMSAIGAALTLPGIAGLILTIAMAVDANVLIYERMREEAAAGRGPAMAIEAGFNRAMITIMDANLTTILAALIMFQFGAGPVRGFAWTLSIGVITSVFTAVLVTQILVAGWFRAARPKQLPI